MPIESGQNKRNAAWTKVCVAFLFILPHLKICAAINKEKRRGVWVVERNVEKMKIRKNQ